MRYARPATQSAAFVTRACRENTLPGNLETSLDYLEKAAAHYDRSFDEGVRYDDSEAVMAPLHWSLTQQLSLWLALRRAPNPETLVTTARFIAQQDMDVGRLQAETWALTTLLELDIIDAWLAATKDEGRAKAEGGRRRHPPAARAHRAPVALARQRRPHPFDPPPVGALHAMVVDRKIPTFPQLNERAPKPVRELHVPLALQTAVEESIARMDDYIRRNPGSVARKR